MVTDQQYLILSETNIYLLDIYKGYLLLKCDVIKSEKAFRIA